MGSLTKIFVGVAIIALIVLRARYLSADLLAVFSTLWCFNRLWFQFFVSITSLEVGLIVMIYAFMRHFKIYFQLVSRIWGGGV